MSKTTRIWLFILIDMFIKKSVTKLSLYCHELTGKTEENI